MSQPNNPNSQGQGAPWYQDKSGQQAKPFPFGNEQPPITETTAAPVQPQIGTPAQNAYGSNPQNAYGSNPAHSYETVVNAGYGGTGYGSEPHRQQGPGPSWNPERGHPQGPPTPHGTGTPPQGAGSQVGAILDPRTGDIHPVADLNQLQETDALLVVVSGPDAGAQILLDTDVVTVGRSPNADIFLDDVTVSRKHAEFVRTPAGFTLRDTGSLNGTYVGRQLIDSIELQNGADVQIGKFRMIFQQRPHVS